jgi:hypothetical protein
VIAEAVGRLVGQRFAVIAEKELEDKILDAMKARSQLPTVS